MSPAIESKAFCFFFRVPPSHFKRLAWQKDGEFFLAKNLGSEDYRCFVSAKTPTLSSAREKKYRAQGLLRRCHSCPLKSRRHVFHFCAVYLGAVQRKVSSTLSASSLHPCRIHAGQDSFLPAKGVFSSAEA